MASWSTVEKLTAALEKYVNPKGGQGILQGFDSEDDGEAYLQARLDEATQLLSVDLGGRCVVADAAAAGLDAICTSLAAALVLQGVYRGIDEQAATDATMFETRANMAMARLLRKPVTELIAMPGIDPVPTTADGESILPIHVRSLPKRGPTVVPH